MKRLIMAGALALAGMTAQGYTPEGGTWFNPDEPGTGVLIELQDNTMVAFVYVYEDDGDPIWFTAAGELDDSSTVFEADLHEFAGGTCVGCEYRENEFVDAVGEIRIEFNPDDPTQAEMTWGLDGGPQRTTDIERYLFALGRAEDGAAPVYITKMMGEWVGTLDLSSNDNADVQYYGEVLVFDFLDFDNSDDQWYFEGCRPEDMLDGFCTNEAFEEHDAAGYFDFSVDRHVIIVTDTRDQFGNPFNCILYDVRVDTNSFVGGLEGRMDGDDDGDLGGVTIYPCGAEDPFDYATYPVRGFRTASRSFMESGEGPSKANTTTKTTSRVGLPLAAAPADDVKRAVRRIPLDRIRALEARIGVQHSD